MKTLESIILMALILALGYGMIFHPGWVDWLAALNR